MRKIDRPRYDDGAILSELENSTAIPPARRRTLKGVSDKLMPYYRSYQVNEGNAFLVPKNLKVDPTLNKDDDLASLLKHYYSAPIKPHTYIKELRESHKANCCPMCGGFDPTELDHVLPKSEYPEFSLFSLNLAPFT